jgi:hypothetical protein
MKTLSIFGDYKYMGESEAFFNGNKLITVIDGNDGNYRDEYMNCLFTSFGIKVKRLDKLNKTQMNALKNSYFGEYLGSGEE